MPHVQYPGDARHAGRAFNSPNPSDFVVAYTWIDVRDPSKGDIGVLGVL